MSIRHSLFFINVVSVIILSVFRDGLARVMSATMGFTDPGIYLDKALYTLIITLAVMLYRVLPGKIPLLWEMIRPKWNERILSVCDGLSGIDRRLTVMDNTISGMDTYVKKEFKDVNMNLFRLDEKISRLEDAREATAKDLERLQKIRRGKMVFLKNLSTDLHKFAVLKANAFTAFVLEMHTIGFYMINEEGTRVPNPRLDFRTIEEDITCSTMEVYRSGCEIMGTAFMELFYQDHMIKMKDYCTYVKNLLEAGDNYKHARFQETSEAFMEDFLERLHHTFIAFAKGVRAGGVPDLFDKCGKEGSEG